MSRLDAVRRNPKRSLGVLATALVAVGIAIGSGANFTAASANPSNTFTAGVLSIDNSLEGAAILTASNMVPGDTATGTVDIKNDGTVAGAFSLSRTDLVDDPVSPAMSSQLDVEVVDCGVASAPDCANGDSVYSGTLAAMNGSYALGNYQPEDEHRFRFTVTFDAGAGNQYQGASSTATFQWNAVSN